jgi:hypothetical protein
VIAEVFIKFIKKENGLHPFRYMEFLLETFPDAKSSDLESLLPWSESLPCLIDRTHNNTDYKSEGIARQKVPHYLTLTYTENKKPGVCEVSRP